MVFYTDRIALRWALISLLGRKLTSFILILSLTLAISVLFICSSIVSGFTKQIEHLTFGEFNRSLKITQNVIAGQDNGPPTLRDRAAIERTVQSVESTAGWISEPVTMLTNTVKINTMIYGAIGDYRREIDADILVGRWLTDHEINNYNRLCLIGYELFLRSDEDIQVGKMIYIDNLPCRVIGIVGLPRSMMAREFSQSIITSLRNVEKYRSYENSDNQNLDWLTVYTKNYRNRHDLEINVDKLLRKMHSIPMRYISPYSYRDNALSKENIERHNSAFKQLIYVINVIIMLSVFITYAVMNIHSLKDRRREFAIRLSIGGYPSDLVKQVAWEHTVISFFGSIGGLLFGILGSLAASALGGWPIYLHWSSGFVAVLAGWFTSGCVCWWVAMSVSKTPPALASKP